MTPFLFYFGNELYSRLQVDAVPPKTDLEVYQTALAEGKITEKGKILKEKLWKINEKERPLFTGYPVSSNAFSSLTDG